MNYEGQICRPPMERGSYMLPVAVGCSYNACKFCTLFKHLKYRELPLEKVEEELLRVKNLGGSPKRIFLGDGNPFGMETEHLLEIIGLIKKYFPLCSDINMDSTVTNIGEKSDEELQTLFENGVRELYLGIECGTQDALEFMRKDHSVGEAHRQIARLKKFGLIYNAHLMLGTAGAGRGEDNAENTARFINETEPKKIINTSIFIHETAPLYRDIEKGKFRPASELENLLEERRFIELLTAPIENYDGFHDYLEIRTRGKLPRDKEKMLAHLDEAIEGYRKGLKNAG